jgi:hypothetical protein
MVALADAGVAPDANVVARWRRELALVTLPALAIFAMALVTQTVFTDGDTNWQVAAGRWILAHRAVPAADPFSYTFLGKPWVTHEWGAEVLLGGAFNLGGWSGVMLITGVAAALAFAIVAAEIAPRLGTLSTICSVGLGFALFLPLLLARPHVIALPVMALWLVRLLKARRDGRSPEPWLIGLMLVWANLHGSYIFGLAFTGAFALEAVVEARGRRLTTALRWGAFLAAATLAAAVTPNGVEGLVFPVRVMLLSSLGDIGEWKSASFSLPTPLEIGLIFTIFVLVYRGVRMGAVRLGLLLLLLHMALQHVRQEAVLAIAAPLLIAEPLGRTLEPDRNVQQQRWTLPPLAEALPPLAVIAALFLGLGAWRLARPVVREDSAATPVTAFAHVPAALAAQPVFNEYSFGGWLIFKGVRPFIDGRADMYGDAFLQNYIAIERNADPVATATTFARWKIAWPILPPDSALGRRLDQTPGWRRLYADKWAVVQARQAGPSPSSR